MKQLTDAFQSADSYERKLKILSISPYSIRKTIELFQTSKYLVEKSRKLTKLYGIIPEVKPVSKGKYITKEIKTWVKEFYCSDSISRICPGKKDCLSLWNEEKGVKESVQKRLVLMNLKEAYALYKESHDAPKIGFSCFTNLRPKNCILAGRAGTHTVCVCCYHQNVKLQISSLGTKDMDYKLLIEKSVCNIENRNCMMLLCTGCPREIGVKKFLSPKLEQLNYGDIKYKQWVSTDRCTLEEVVESSELFLDSLCKKINTLTRHHYVAKMQSDFLKNLKNNLQSTEVIVLGDFAENYSFVIQDEIQGFHWENSQCTLHPFVIYYRTNSENKITNSSFCFLSADTKHRTSMVYSFLCKLIPRIKEKCPNTDKIHYFTDGCAGQYKNKYNFINICNHLKDFKISCEWHFFATSHGKNACDGIGAVIKRSTAKASLQRTFANQILTVDDMYTFCTESLSEKIEFFLIKPETIVELEENVLKKRFSEAATIKGTQKFHKFVPVNETKIKVFELSYDPIGEERNIIINKCHAEDETVIKVKPKIGDYVVCSYNDKKWVGFILSYNEEFNDYEVDFLYPSGISEYYHYPEIRDKCHVINEKCLGILDTVTLKAGTRRIQYQFAKAQLTQFMN